MGRVDDLARLQPLRLLSLIPGPKMSGLATQPAPFQIQVRKVQLVKILGGSLFQDPLEPFTAPWLGQNGAIPEKPIQGRLPPGLGVVPIRGRLSEQDGVVALGALPAGADKPWRVGAAAPPGTPRGSPKARWPLSADPGKDRWASNLRITHIYIRQTYDVKR